MTSKITDLLDRLANLVEQSRHRVAVAHGLNSAQAGVLLYLFRANHYSNTPAAVTEYLGLTKGTVSQSILRLEQSGWLRRRPDQTDARVVRVDLTPRARRLIDQYRGGLEDAIAAAQPAGLEAQLESLLLTIQRAHGGRTFGVCRTCRFFQEDGAEQFRCGLTGEPLKLVQISLICREHEHAAA